jgi:protein SCO1
MLHRILWFLLIAICVATIALTVWLRLNRLPAYGSVPDFRLTSQRGQTITRADLLGQPAIVDFIFTTCPGVCPILTERLKDLGTRLPLDQIRLVSLTVDPARDTPEALAAYATKHQADPRWFFLTGPEAVLYPLIRDGFKVVIDPAPRQEGAEAIVHSNRFVLVDRFGQIRGYYNAFEADEVARLEKDARRLVSWLGRIAERRPLKPT